MNSPRCSDIIAKKKPVIISDKANGKDCKTKKNKNDEFAVPTVAVYGNIN